MSTTSQQIHGIANLLEGEGCFSFRVSPMIQLRMKDEDIIVRTRSLMCPDNKITIEYKEKKGWNTTYVITISGMHAIEWMMTIYSLMGRRRKEKIREILIKWKEMPHKQRGSDHCKEGHSLLIKDNYYTVLNPSGYPVKRCRICRNKHQMEYRKQTFG